MERVRCDLLVVGSGAAGLTAAVTAAHHGLKVIVAEKEPVFGGTTAYSAGVIWIPCNALAVNAGIEDSAQAALRYIQEEAGKFYDGPKAEAFVQAAPRMLEFMLANSHVRYQLIANWADYHPARPGASLGGRSLLPEPFDGRLLGDWFPLLRAPLPTMMLFGGMSVSRADIPHLLNATRSVRAGFHVLAMLARYARDRLRWHRGTALANGNALIGRLAFTLRKRGVPLWVDSSATQLIERGSRVCGAYVRRAGVTMEVRAGKGVILACGGFPRSDEWRTRDYPHVAAGKNHNPLAPPGNTGDGIRMAIGLGAGMSDAANAAAWAPVSLSPGPGGAETPYPHFIDRCKPGFIAVDRRGQRFANEADSYHDFVPLMVRACRHDAAIESFLLCDHAALRHYGMGVVPPAPMPIGRFLSSGYLKKGRTLEDLAANVGIDARGLADTVRRFNANAKRGEDPDFGKGSNVYNHFGGDPMRKPNPNLAPLEQAPFYAVRLVPGDLGTFKGLVTDAAARVLRVNDGQPIHGLYAVGNDMASVMGGAYPGAGITIGPGMTFGYLAARHAAGLAD